MRYVLSAVAGATFAVGVLHGASAADMPVKAIPKSVASPSLATSGYLELYGGWERNHYTNSLESDLNENDNGWLLGGAGRANVWINPSFSMQFDAQGEGTQYQVESKWCNTSSQPCNYSAHGYLLTIHATWREAQRGGIGVFVSAGDMTVPSTGGNCNRISVLSCNASVRIAIGGAEAFANWNQFTFYIQGGYGGTVGDNLSIEGSSVAAPFLRGTVRYYPAANWLLEGTVMGSWATISPFTAGNWNDQRLDSVLWRAKVETMVHPNISIYAAYQGSETVLTCNGSFCSPSGMEHRYRNDRVIGGVRLWLNRDNLRGNDITGAPLDLINPLGFISGLGIPDVKE